MSLKTAFLLSFLIGFAAVYTSPTANNASFSPKIHEIIDLIPKTKIEEITQAHLEKDQGFRAAIFYLQSREWRDLVDTVLKKAEFERFSKMASKYKLNISQAITCIRKQIDSLVVPEKPIAEPNLEPFLKEIQAIIPVTEIAKALTFKSDTPEAKKYREELSSEENQKIAEAMHNLPEMVKMREILKKMKFDVEPYIALVYTFLGWVH